MELVNRVSFSLDLDQEIKTLVIVDNEGLPNYQKLFKIEDSESLEKLEMLNIITNKLAVDTILKDDDFLLNFNLLILNITTNNNLYNHIFLKIFNHKYVRGVDLPKLKIYNYTPNLETFGLSIKNISSEKDYRKIKIETLDKEISLEEKFKKIHNHIKSDKYDGEIVLIFIDVKKEAYKYFKDKKYRIINFSRNEKLNSRSVKKNILILEKIIPLPYDNIKTIFDLSFKSNENLELLKNYIREAGEIHRLNTSDNLKKLPIFNSPYFDEDTLYKYYLKILNNPCYNVDSVLDRYPVQETFKKLKTLGIITKNTILIDSYLLLKIPLSLRPSLVIYHIIKNYHSLPLFPFIVLACVIDKKLVFKDTLEFFRLWNIFMEKFSSLVVDSLLLDEWLSEYVFSSLVFKDILENIKKVYSTLCDDFTIELGMFNYNNLIRKAKPVLNKAYKGDIYKLMEKGEYLYTNNKDILKIEDKPLDKYPEIIVSFKNDEDTIYSYLDLTLNDEVF